MEIEAVSMVNYGWNGCFAIVVPDTITLRPPHPAMGYSKQASATLSPLTPLHILLKKSKTGQHPYHEVTKSNIAVDM